MRRWVGWLIVGAWGVAIAGLASGLGYASLVHHDVASPYDPLPESIWTAPDGFVLVRTREVQGNSCCEPNPGGRMFWLDIGSQGLDKVTGQLTTDLQTQGWALEPGTGTDKWILLSRDDLSAAVGPREYGPRSAEVVVSFSRQLD